MREFANTLPAISEQAYSIWVLSTIVWLSISHSQLQGIESWYRIHKKNAIITSTIIINIPFIGYLVTW